MPEKVFGPPAIVVGGFSEDQLGFLDDILFQLQLSALPTVVLSRADLEDKVTTLKQLLLIRQERDHELPDEPPILNPPFLLFSGMQREQVRACIRALKTMQQPGGGQLPTCAVSVAVPPAADKLMGALVREVQGDFRANA